MSVSVIYPARNEEAHIASLLREHYAYLSRYYGDELELIVVVDGCADGTPRVVGELSQHIPLSVLYGTEPSAKVGAIMAGFRQATGDVVAFCDTDGFLAPQQLHSLILSVQTGQADCALSSRFTPGSRRLDATVDTNRLVDRYRLTNFFSRIIYGLEEIDIECGAKALTRRACEIWLAEAKADHFYFDAEMLFLLRRAGLKIVELPVEWTFIDKRPSPQSPRARLGSALRLSNQVTQIARLLLLTRLRHVQQCAPLLERMTQARRATLGLTKRAQRSVVQSILFAPHRLLIVGKTPLAPDVANVLRKVASLSAVRSPIWVMPDANWDRWGVPSGTVIDSEIVIPTAVRDNGCGYQILHLPALGRPELAELARQIKTSLSYDAQFRREQTQWLSAERILLEGMRYMNALGLVSAEDLCVTERQGSVTGAAIEGFDEHVLTIARDYLGMFAEHFLEIREVQAISHPQAAAKLGISQGDLIMIIHAGALGLRSEIYRLFYVRMARQLMSQDRNPSITPALIKAGLFAVPMASEIGGQFYGAAQALMNYSYVNRSLVRKLITEVLAGTVGAAHSLHLLSDLSHTALDQLDGCGVRHRRGAQRVYGFAAPELTGYAARRIGPPTLLGGSRETPSFLFASELEQSISFCPHGSEAPELEWRRYGVKSDLSSRELRQYGENAVLDTIPILKEEALESKYLNTLFVASCMERTCGLTRICRLMPRVNLQIHGGGALPMIAGTRQEIYGEHP